MKTTSWKSALAAAIAGVIITGAGNAQIVLSNGGFETTTPVNPLPSGTQVYFDNTSYVLANWTEYNGANTTAGYVYNRNATQWSNGYGSIDKTPFGNNVLGLGRGAASSVIQTLGQVVTGESYALSGYIGRPSDLGTNPTGGYNMSLFIGATAGALTTAIMTLNNVSVTDPTVGTWSSWGGTSSVITSGQNGQYLTAYIYANTGTYPSCREFDNIAITTIPEPATCAMLALAGLGFGAHVIRRRRK